MKSSIRFVLLVGAVFGAICVATASAQTTLRWKFAPGQVFHQTISQDMKMAMKMGERNIDTGVTQTVDAVWKVKEVDSDGNAQIEQEITRIRMNMATAGVTVNFDSDSDQPATGIAKALEPALKAMANAKFIMKMSPRGQILEVEVTEDTMNALNALPGGGQAGGALTKEGLINMIKQGTPAMPAEPVQPGATWSSDAEMPLSQLGKMKSQTTLKYVGPVTIDGRNLEQIDLDTKINFEAGDSPLGKVTMKDQSAKGQLYFDNAAGRLSHSEISQNMTLQMPFGDAGSIDQKIEQKITVKLTPAES